VACLTASKSLRDRQSYIKDSGLPPRGLFSRRKIPFSGSKNRYLADFAPGDSERIPAKSGKG
ncbi:MAG: hypothetical protein SOR74_00100, partial [Candidatus Faecivicinus sp.]|nr:hypothetical protein [Candidatus Faecivicinus sp.]